MPITRIKKEFGPTRRVGIKLIPSASTRVGMQPGTFDFAVDGGAVSDINMGMGLIPAGSKIVRLALKTGADVVSGTNAATIAFVLKDSAGSDVLTLQAATLVSDASFGAAADTDIVDGDAANHLGKTSADARIFMRIAVEDLTGGDLELFCDYVVGE
jgi:hypothetical protein